MYTVGIPFTGVNQVDPPHVDHAPYPPQVDHAPYPSQLDHAPYPPQVDHAPYPPQVDHAPYPPQVDHVHYSSNVDNAPCPARGDQAINPSSIVSPSTQDPISPEHRRRVASDGRSINRTATPSAGQDAPFVGNAPSGAAAYRDAHRDAHRDAPLAHRDAPRAHRRSSIAAPLNGPRSSSDGRPNVSETRQPPLASAGSVAVAARIAPNPVAGETAPRDQNSYKYIGEPFRDVTGERFRRELDTRHLSAEFAASPSQYLVQRQPGDVNSRRRGHEYRAGEEIASVNHSPGCNENAAHAGDIVLEQDQSHTYRDAANYVPNQTTNFMPDHTTNYISDHALNYTPEHAPNYTSEHAPNYTSEHAPNYTTEHAPNYTPEHAPNHYLNQAPVVPAQTFRYTETYEPRLQQQMHIATPLQTTSTSVHHPMAANPTKIHPNTNFATGDQNVPEGYGPIATISGAYTSQLPHNRQPHPNSIQHPSLPHADHLTSRPRGDHLSAYPHADHLTSRPPSAERQPRYRHETCSIPRTNTYPRGYNGVRRPAGVVGILKNPAESPYSRGSPSKSVVPAGSTTKDSHRTSTQLDLAHSGFSEPLTAEQVDITGREGMAREGIVERGPIGSRGGEGNCVSRFCNIYEHADFDTQMREVNRKVKSLNNQKVI